MLAVLAFGLLIASSVSAAELPKTTWQTYFTGSDFLVVHVSDDSTSAVCWQGKATSLDNGGNVVQNYHGQCVSR